MKTNLRAPIVLLVIGTVSAVSISLVASFARPRIESHRRATFRTAIREVLPGAARFEPVKGRNNEFSGIDSIGQVVGYTVLAEGGGYQGVIRLLIGLSPDRTRLSRIAVLENVETPGLGAKITSDAFLRQFNGIPLTREIEYVLNSEPAFPQQVQAITGATISSRSVISIINRAVRSRQRPSAEEDK